MRATLRHTAFLAATLSLSLFLTQIVHYVNRPFTKLAQVELKGTSGFDTNYTVNGPWAPYDCNGDLIQTLKNKGQNVLPESGCNKQTLGSDCAYCDQDEIGTYEGISSTPSQNGGTETSVDCGVANLGTCQYYADEDAYHCRGRIGGNNCTNIAAIGYQIKPIPIGSTITSGSPQTSTR